MFHISEHRYGKVDQVPGVFHRATRFFAFNFFPLIPLGGVLVLEKPYAGSKEVSIKAPMCLASFMVAYLRFFLLLIGLSGTIVGSSMLLDGAWKNPVTQNALVVGITSLLAWWLSHRLTYAGYATAHRWAQFAGVPADIIEEHFQRKTPRSKSPPERTESAIEMHEQKDDVFRLE